MADLNAGLSYLKRWERWCSGLVGVATIGLALWLCVAPPMRESITTDSTGLAETTQTQTDQPTIAVVLFTVGAAAIFYAVNGLRLTKFAAGPFSGESEKPEGIARSLEEPANEVKSGNEQARKSFISLGKEEKKILRTLWYHQTSIFKDFKTRWTFRVKGDAPEFSDFLQGVALLSNKGYVWIDPSTMQCALTNEGIVLMRSLREEETRGDMYVF